MCKIYTDDTNYASKYGSILINLIATSFMCYNSETNKFTWAL